jgi:hypothetical protein
MQGATDMLFGKRNRRPPAPVGRTVVTPADHARGIIHVSNGPDTPVMDVSAMKRALNHAAWRDPSLDRRKNDEVRAAIRTLERTAACVDLAQERLNEAAETLMLGQSSPERVMRGLLTARFEELLDSLERVAILAQDGYVNLLGGAGDAPHQQTTKFRVAEQQNGLSLDIGTAGFSYVLTPIDIRRRQTGLDIPVLESGFDDAAETYGVETAVLRAQKRLAQFGERLSHDAVMLVKIAQANEAEYAKEPDLVLSSANDDVTLQTKSEDVA